MNLVALFEKANENFLRADIDLFNMKVSERTLCGALMLQLHESLKNTEYSKYHIDVEYNRNKGGKIKTCIQKKQNKSLEIVKINCDLIIHSRGSNIIQDNLIAVEMKKSTAPEKEKTSDRYRLMALTKQTFDDIWSFDGKTLPEHVCRYKLGVFYEVFFKMNKVSLEYYASGEQIGLKEVYY